MNHQYNNTNRNQSLLFSACVLLDGDMYSVTSLEGIPIKVNLESGIITYLNELKKNDFIKTEDMLNDSKEIFILEQSGHRMMKFNIDNKLCSYYDISCHKKEWGNYAAYTKYKKFFYIFPKYVNYVLKIDLETGLIEKDSSIYTEIEKLYQNVELKDSFVYFWCGVASRNVVWLFQRGRSEVIAYDLETRNWRKYMLPLKVDSCVDIVMKENLFYILSSEGKVYIWNSKSDDMKLLADCSNEKNGGAFARIVVTDETVVMLPTISNDIYLINIKNGKKNLYNDYPDHFEYCAPKTWSKYSGYCEDEDNYYFAMRSSLFILCVSKKNNELKWLKTIAPSNEEYFKMHYKIGNFLDDKEWSLIEVLDYIENENINKEKYKNIGKQIWNQIR